MFTAQGGPVKTRLAGPLQHAAHDRSADPEKRQHRRCRIGEPYRPQQGNTLADVAFETIANHTNPP